MENCDTIMFAIMDAVRLLAIKDPDVADYTRTAASMRMAMEVCRMRADAKRSAADLIQTIEAYRMMRADAKRVEAEELVYDYSQEVQP